MVVTGDGEESSKREAVVSCVWVEKLEDTLKDKQRNECPFGPHCSESQASYFLFPPDFTRVRVISSCPWNFFSCDTSFCSFTVNPLAKSCSMLHDG